MHFYSESNSRGNKRLLEQEKFRYLGQLQTLRSIFSRFTETSFDMDSITKDKLYALIYMQISELYKCGINQKFMLDFIDLKNKKRESKKCIIFLEGAHSMLQHI